MCVQKRVKGENRRAQQLQRTKKKAIFDAAVLDGEGRSLEAGLVVRKIEKGRGNNWPSYSGRRTMQPKCTRLSIYDSSHPFISPQPAESQKEYLLPLLPQ
ncbi:hypothetical protein CCM_02579 [Cordyceps militaris CM01]|uniref:Uncharacterized protein n=1 Tax=Cordyceps militaris (strain CM01) TaxID=983644 RepID=G3JAJ2_CORMM|nr:uncharacterized protein CCM_02579 [Cordyceps militaris CM01]EGX94308.1 hypothetical protein CCM_02579 [Cordyceps militaris CM01]